MKITKVEYRETMTFGNYQNATVGAVAEVNEGDNPDDTFRDLHGRMPPKAKGGMGFRRGFANPKVGKRWKNGPFSPAFGLRFWSDRRIGPLIPDTGRVRQSPRGSAFHMREERG